MKVLFPGSYDIMPTPLAGDYYGDGKLRREELIASVAVLGIPSSNVQIINDKYVVPTIKLKATATRCSHVLNGQVFCCLDNYLTAPQWSGEEMLSASTY